METIRRVPPLVFVVVGALLTVLGLYLLLAPGVANAQSAIPALTGPDLGIERAEAFDRSLTVTDAGVRDAGR